MVAKQANKKNAGKPCALTINALAKLPPKWILHEFNVSRIRPC